MADDEDLTLDLSKKKKKKVKQIVLDDEVVVVQNDSQAIIADDSELVLGKKPKKKEVKLDDSEKTTQEADEVAVGIGRLNLIDSENKWPDYAYDTLLDMVFDIMREKNPEMTSGKKKTFSMKPPQIVKAGSKKTAFANFAEICRLMKRQPRHVLQFLMAELGTTGSIDGNECLIVKGRFQQKHFESVLRKYIKEYVTCHTCRSSETDLTKDVRLFFLTCKTCGSRVTVTAIKSGFTAMIGKRAAARAAAGN